MKSDLVDIEVALHHQTDKAWLVSLDGERENAIWIPKSQCEIHQQMPGGPCELTCTEQVAIDFKLV